MRIWHRSRARIRRMCSGGATPATRLPPAIGLPMEIVEMVIAHLVYDKHSLLACSLTCYSWYLAAVPHLHHTLTAQTFPWGEPWKTMWPKPLLRMQRLGSLPLVKKLHIHEDTYYEELERSYPAEFRWCISHLSALTNLQELGGSLFGYPQAHTEASTVLWSLPTDTPVSLLERPGRVTPADCILHWAFSALGRPQTPL